MHTMASTRNNNSTGSRPSVNNVGERGGGVSQLLETMNGLHRGMKYTALLAVTGTFPTYIHVEWMISDVSILYVLPQEARDGSYSNSPDSGTSGTCVMSGHLVGEVNFKKPNNSIQKMIIHDEIPLSFLCCCCRASSSILNLFGPMGEWSFSLSRDVW